jgi:hypothetical protein
MSTFRKKIIYVYFIDFFSLFQNWMIKIKIKEILIELLKEIKLIELQEDQMNFLFIHLVNIFIILLYYSLF